ncbi:hypothetical protein [Oceanicella sp. SM1341]|uniref:hypothetical protein n=1 Tax=Oceanicella sp. SM1341 TaxID=1548889 RepID=UPI000E515613|nr:hypothetical protein [Oceanicella sp. SM1341]
MSPAVRTLTPELRRDLRDRLLAAPGESIPEIFAHVAAETGLARELIWCAVKDLDERGMPRRGRRTGYSEGSMAARIIAARRRVAAGEPISAVRRSMGGSMAEVTAMLHGHGRFAQLRPTLAELVAEGLANGIANNLEQRKEAANG